MEQRKWIAAVLLAFLYLATCLVLGLGGSDTITEVVTLGVTFYAAYFVGLVRGFLDGIEKVRKNNEKLAAKAREAQGQKP